jgi:hypothetical protein
MLYELSFGLFLGRSLLRKKFPDYYFGSYNVIFLLDFKEMLLIKIICSWNMAGCSLVYGQACIPTKTDGVMGQKTLYGASRVPQNLR